MQGLEGSGGVNAVRSGGGYGVLSEGAYAVGAGVSPAVRDGPLHLALFIECALVRCLTACLMWQAAIQHIFVFPPPSFILTFGQSKIHPRQRGTGAFSFFNRSTAGSPPPVWLHTRRSTFP